MWHSTDVVTSVVTDWTQENNVNAEMKNKGNVYSGRAEYTYQSRMDKVHLILSRKGRWFSERRIEIVCHSSGGYSCYDVYISGKCRGTACAKNLG